MRKVIKDSLLEIVGTFYDAHESLRILIDKKEYNDAISMLGDCQNSAVEIGEVIEKSEGEGFVTIHLLEEYCEVLYQVSTAFSEEYSGSKAKKQLDKSLLKVENSIKNDILVKREIAFLPYKAAMWDSLEGEWRRATKDPECEVFVVPIPYYDRNPGGFFGECHYEGSDFPDYVPITYYENYDLEERMPDEIYIHNPYDDTNFITSVDPRYYSSELKKYTNCLIYIPYFVLAEGTSPKNFCANPGCKNADKVIVQSESLRQEYIHCYSEVFGKNYGVPEKKFVVGESSKISKAQNDSKDQYKLPEKWKNLIGDRKVILYNTSLATMLKEEVQYMKKLRWVLSFFFKRDDVALWWRPHPLTRASLNSMRHEMLNEYDEIVEEFLSANYGIFDDTADLHRAIAYSDAYYGDQSSVVEMYKVTKKPIMIQNIYILDDCGE